MNRCRPAFAESVRRIFAKTGSRMNNVFDVENTFTYFYNPSAGSNWYLLGVEFHFTVFRSHLTNLDILQAEHLLLLVCYVIESDMGNHRKAMKNILNELLMVISFPVVKIALKEWDFQHLAASHPPQRVWKLSNCMESLGEQNPLKGNLLQDLYTNDWNPQGKCFQTKSSSWTGLTALLKGMHMQILSHFQGTSRHTGLVFQSYQEFILVFRCTW